MPKRARGRPGPRSSAAPEAVRPLGLARSGEEVSPAAVALHVSVVGGELRLDWLEVRGLELAIQAPSAPPPRRVDPVRHRVARAIHSVPHALRAVEADDPGSRRDHVAGALRGTGHVLAGDLAAMRHPALRRTLRRKDGDGPAVGRRIVHPIGGEDVRQGAANHRLADSGAGDAADQTTPFPEARDPARAGERDLADLRADLALDSRIRA